MIGRGGREILWELEGVEIVRKIYYMRKLFLIKGKIFKWEKM